MTFPQYPTVCEICKINVFDYVGHIIFCGQQVLHECHVLCHTCISEHIIDILGEFTVYLDCYSLPIIIHQYMDYSGEDGIDKPHLVPIQRKGALFNYEV